MEALAFRLFPSLCPYPAGYGLSLPFGVRVLAFASWALLYQIDHSATGGSSQRIRSGSPPHAWGSALLRGAPQPTVRFTPTRVGIGMMIPSLCRRYSVHPHTRGDRLRMRARLTPVSGSPPHAWGSVMVDMGFERVKRFTPTRVGIGFICQRSGHRGAVHPHTRGDRVRQRVLRRCNRGSPPHAWGSVR